MNKIDPVSATAVALVCAVLLLCLIQQLQGWRVQKRPGHRECGRDGQLLLLLLHSVRREVMLMSCRNTSCMG
jgi:hypothetical protein